ncbi:YHYH domain-containing protein [Paenibacillus sp. Soil766]|uniref:YHYH domain-containing protein n=1 Tax=Paenibacillus sp. Soil766 TaxID=1736404 RepID=UPI000B22D46B|nr:YHYH domain-containing protein [Paenibacillus sp. Soil766]
MKNFIILCLLCLAAVISCTNVSAHPGRQDSEGGHTCRTNCPEWGLDYGEYHYHNYTNNGESNPPTPRDSVSIPGWVVWGVIITTILIFVIVRYNATTPKHRPRTNIDVPLSNSPPPAPVTYPPDEEVELNGILTRTAYRNTPFFVAKFTADDGNTHTIVGNYSGRLYTNKRYIIRGTNTFDRRYG